MADNETRDDQLDTPVSDLAGTPEADVEDVGVVDLTNDGQPPAGAASRGDAALGDGGADHGADSGALGDGGADHGADSGALGDGGADHGADSGAVGDGGADHGADSGALGDGGADRGADGGATRL